MQTHLSVWLSPVLMRPSYFAYSGYGGFVYKFAANLFMYCIDEVNFTFHIAVVKA